MSGTANEFENPGANYPDRRDVEGIEPEVEEMRATDRDNASHAPTDLDSTAATQDEPLLEQHETTTAAKIDGIAQQTLSDLGTAPAERYEEVLRQRFKDAGLVVPDEQIRALAEKLATGAGT